MADSVVQNGFDLTNRNKTYNASTDFDAYINRWAEKDKDDALYEDKSTLSFTDMLGLMVAQFQNQTIDNQASTTDMMNQLVQMTTMQAMTDLTTKMDEVALANVMSYSASLVGQTVTLGIYDAKGNLTEKVGVVEGAGTYNGQQVIFVEGKSYALSSIMAVGKLPPRVDPDEKPGEGEDGDKTEGTDTDNDTDTDNSTDTDNDTNTDGSGSDDGGAVS